MPASLGSASSARSCVSALACLAWDRRLECKQPASLGRRMHVPALDGRCNCPGWVLQGDYVHCLRAARTDKPIQSGALSCLLQGRQQQPAHWRLAIFVGLSAPTHRTVSTTAARYAIMMIRDREQCTKLLSNWPQGRRAAKLSLLTAWLSQHTYTGLAHRPAAAWMRCTELRCSPRRGWSSARPAGRDSTAAAAAWLIMPASLGGTSSARSRISALAWLAWDRRLDCKQPASLGRRMHVPALDGCRTLAAAWFL
jgi:hypothetical protein